MILSIRTIPEGKSVLCQTVAIDADPDVWPPEALSLTCRAQIDRMDARMWVRIEYDGAIGQDCSRCCTRFSHHLRGEVSVLLKNTSIDTEHLEDGEEESDFLFNDATDQLDIRKALIDEIITTLPMMPLCADTCEGIMVSGESESATDSADPRWEALKKLKSKTK